MRERFKQWHLYVLLAMVFSLGLLFIKLVPGGGSAGEVLKYGLLGLIVLITILTGPFFAGMFFRWKVIPPLDDLIDYDNQITLWGDLFISILFGILSAGLWLVAVPALTTLPTWVIDLFTFFEYGDWNGVYETPPIGWGIYSLVFFIVGYYCGKAGYDQED